VFDQPDERQSRDRTSAASEFAMRFSDAGLVLGAGTVLARAGASAKDITVDVTEPRLLALLAAAHLRQPTPLGLAHIHKAVERWRIGEDAFAAMHLALSRLDRLEHPIVDARCLVLADGLLEAGFAADTIVKALDIDAPPVGQLRKYSPDRRRSSAPPQRRPRPRSVQRSRQGVGRHGRSRRIRLKVARTGAERRGRDPGGRGSQGMDAARYANLCSDYARPPS
jgi:hypothetical protein